jgi:hypothetical protein
MEIQGAAEVFFFGKLSKEKSNQLNNWRKGLDDEQNLFYMDV